MSLLGSQSSSVLNSIVSPRHATRDTRELLKSASVDDAYAFVDSNSHPRLWRNLAEHALEALDFTTADKAFVRCADYQVGRNSKPGGTQRWLGTHGP